jgi:hypothetical protein
VNLPRATAARDCVSDDEICFGLFASLETACDFEGMGFRKTDRSKLVNIGMKES